MLQPGSRLGRYEIRSLLGAGGMGEVYLAHDAQLQRPVALKVLAAAVRADEDLRSRLELEARAASALNHPNILTVYDVGEEGEERFIATEYVDGVTLRQRLSRAQPTLREVVEIGMQVASALAAAEGAGLVHRDIKPDNIMLRRDGYVKLLDFGLARTHKAQTSSDQKRTDPYTVRGTVFYMSPEQLRGMVLDTRSDIWSTGIVLYELVSGRLPFEGDSTTDTAASILRNDPPVLVHQDGTAVAPRLAHIIARAMTKDRSLRYQTAQEMLDELQRLRVDLERNAESVIGSDESRLATTEQVPVFELPQTNLPQRLTPLVGRDAERDDVLSLLRRDDVRLVTLTGPGGTGKTRLATEIGNELLREMDDGVWWISLAPIRDARLVLSELAAVLDVAEGGPSLHDAVRAAIRDRTMLLVLDNFEQVLDAAPIIGQLLAGAPRVKALVTSRSPLRIGGEREYAVPPLTTPPLDLPLDAQALGHYASVALFVERATSVKSDFMLTAENAPAIAELCVRLDGLPLAIELAAARVKVLPPRAMLARVENRFGLLAGGSRDLPERQQTMRAAISWGYQLLTDSEQKLFASLAVFRGGFTLEQAERLSNDPFVLDGISSLLDKAFLRRDPASPDEAPRFMMLETIRDYGLEVLTEQSRDAELRHAHAVLMTAIAEENELDADRLDADDDNFRTAIDSAVAARDPELSLRLGAALWWSWYVRGHYTEGRRALDAILAVADGDDVPVRAKAQTGAGALAFLQCDYDRAIELLESSIVLSKRHGDPMSLARSLQFRGSIARERGEYEHAIDLHLLSRTIWAELEDRANVGRSLNLVAFSSWLSGDFARTNELCEGTLQLFKERHDTEGVVWSLLNLAAAALYSGNARLAEQRLDECLSWSRAGGFKEGVAWSLNLLGCALRVRNEPRAESILQDSLRLHWELGDRWRSASVLEALGGVRRDPQLLGAAATLRTMLGTPVPPAERSQVDADIAAIGVVDCDVSEAVEKAL
ncbi:MAG TPA: protein kinase [Thermoanaerobaculia bacterium]|nr:protein kinase [Thermoanaerobaculia bacterium]